MSMKKVEASAGCSFCSKFSLKFSLSRTREWYDEPIIEDSHFVAIPTLGQLVPGYLLVVSRKHVLSMAQLTVEELLLLRRFCSKVARLQHEIWDWPIIFEHGICREDKPAGACINHAHWHMVPGYHGLLPSSARYDHIESFENFAEKEGRNRPYLYLEDQQHQAFVLNGENTQGQFFRRQLARIIGRPDEWDYAVFPFFENIRQTYQLTAHKTGQI